MVIINLLPWRKSRYEFENKKIKQLISTSIVVTAFVIMMSHFIFATKINALQVDRYRLKIRLKQVAILQKKITNESEQSTYVTGLNKNTKEYFFATQRLFGELETDEDTSICFTDIKRSKNKITFSGNALSVFDLTEFLKHWSAWHLFTEIKIDEIKQQQTMHFRFHAIEKAALRDEEVF